MTREECGRQRYMTRRLIRAVLIERGLSMSELGRQIGVSAEAVSATVRGKKHSPRVLDALRDSGVPEQYLFDPHVMQEKVA